MSSPKRRLPVPTDAAGRDLTRDSRSATRRSTGRRPDHRRRRDEAIDQLHRVCAVYTKPEIVERILDAVGWRDDNDLTRCRLLEPGAGNGEFVVRAARRLVSSCRRHGIRPSIRTLSDSITAFEFQRHAAIEARSRVVAALREMGIHHKTAKACGSVWIRHDDFLLADMPRFGFTHVVGNPPYMRWSKVPAVLRSTYDDLLPRETTRGDLFLPFLDRALDHMAPTGECGILCSDRWKYMAFAEDFRKKWLPWLDISSNDSLAAADAFTREVAAYPTILIARKRSTTRLDSSGALDRSSKTLGELGYVVKVGPALGHKPAFVLERDEDDVEQQLLHAWIDSTEISDGFVEWRGRRVITMFDGHGNLVDLRQFPKLARRLRKFSPTLRDRCIVRNGAPWYRPIERVRAVDWSRPKLLVPGLAKVPRIAIDRSGAIPSHGVYAIFSSTDADIESLYGRLSDGQLASALDGIAPKVKAGYVRCYRRFLMMIKV